MRNRRQAHRLSVDNDHCRRFGFCVAAAPALFQLLPNGGLRYRRTVPAEWLDEARAAERGCPTLAIELKLAIELNEGL